MFKISSLQHFLFSIFNCFFYILVTKYIEMFTFSAAKISISTQMIICFLQGIFLLFFWINNISTFEKNNKIM